MISYKAHFILGVLAAKLPSLVSPFNYADIIKWSGLSESVVFDVAKELLSHHMIYKTVGICKITTKGVKYIETLI